MATKSIAESVPDARGRFGAYGGRYVPETLMAPLEELERAYKEARSDAKFQKELDDLLHNFAAVGPQHAAVVPKPDPGDP